MNLSVSRRQFLAASVAASATAGLAAGPEVSKVPTVRKPAKRVIFVLMSGGPSQMETFDPKTGAPTGGPFGSIPTRTPGMRFCEYLPKLAAMSDQFAVVRSMTGPAPGGDHIRDVQYALTGHYNKSKVGVVRPAFGSIMAMQFGRPDAKLPGYVNLSPTWNDGTLVRSGCLGARYDLMHCPGYGKVSGVTTRPAGFDAEASKARETLRDKLSRQFMEGRLTQNAQRYEESFARARGLMDSAGVFDLTREPQHIRERYGPSRYGADCLTARRLLEADVPFVLIQCFGTRCDWDWHYEAFSHLSKYMLGVFDQVTTMLIEDLKQRGLWDDTLLICTGEFGRTPSIGSNEANGYSGRAHWSKTYAMMLGGGPIKGGVVVGETNALGTEIKSRPVTHGDLYRTYYPALGINPDKKFYVSGQPVPFQEEGTQAITELLA